MSGTDRENTERVQRVVHDELEPIARKLTNGRTILSAVGILIAMGFLAAVYLSRFATAQALEDHEAKSTAANGTVAKRVGDLEVEVAVQKEWRRHVDEDVGYLVKQVRAIAQSPRAPDVIELPKHKHTKESP